MLINILLVLAAIAALFAILAFRRIGKLITVQSALLELNGTIYGALKSIAEGQRLSTILSLSPSSLTVDPAQFEPEREVLIGRMKRTLLEAQKRHDDDPDTYAFCVLNHSGWNTFVDGNTFQSAKTALARLLANRNMDGARAFLETLVNQL